MIRKRNRERRKRREAAASEAHRAEKKNQLFFSLSRPPQWSTRIFFFLLQFSRFNYSPSPPPCSLSYCENPKTRKRTDYQVAGRRAGQWRERLCSLIPEAGTREREKKKTKKKRKMESGFGIASRPSLQESPSAEAGTSASVLWSSGGSGLGALYALGGIGDSGRGGHLAASRLSYAGGGGVGVVGAAEQPDAAASAAAASAAASLAAAAAATFTPAQPASIPQQQPSSREVDALDLMSDLW